MSTIASSLKITARYGVALLSRYPVTDWRVLRLPSLRVPVPLWRGRRRPVLVRDEARVALSATVQTPGADVLVVTTHLSFLAGWNVIQLFRLWRTLSTSPGPILLMGDLNMGARRASTVTGLQPLATHPTFPVDRPRRQLDHILARDLEPRGAGRALRLPLSDHLALAVDVERHRDAT